MKEKHKNFLISAIQGEIDKGSNQGDQLQRALQAISGLQPERISRVAVPSYVEVIFSEDEPAQSVYVLEESLSLDHVDTLSANTHFGRALLGATEGDVVEWESDSSTYFCILKTIE